MDYKIKRLQKTSAVWDTKSLLAEKSQQQDYFGKGRKTLHTSRLDKAEGKATWAQLQVERLTTSEDKGNRHYDEKKWRIAGLNGHKF